MNQLKWVESEHRFVSAYLGRTLAMLVLAVFGELLPPDSELTLEAWFPAHGTVNEVVKP